MRGKETERAGVDANLCRIPRNINGRPSEWTRFEWKSTKRFRNYLSVVTLLSTFLLSELNVFYLK